MSEPLDECARASCTYFLVNRVFWINGKKVDVSARTPIDSARGSLDAFAIQFLVSLV